MSRGAETWTRRNEIAGIAVSSEGSASEMITNSCIIDNTGARYMLYAGDTFGEGGVGLAILEQD